jgi:hypothetical protein
MGKFYLSRIKYKKVYKTIHPDRMTIENYFLQLDILENKLAVNQYIIKPLIQIYEGNIDEAYKTFELACLFKEEIII